MKDNELVKNATSITNLTTICVMTMDSFSCTLSGLTTNLTIIIYVMTTVTFSFQALQILQMLSLCSMESDHRGVSIYIKSVSDGLFYNVL